MSRHTTPPDPKKRADLPDAPDDAKMIDHASTADAPESDGRATRNADTGECCKPVSTPGRDAKQPRP